MNIGVFSETYAPEINGIVTSLTTFRTELERAGHKVYVFAPTTELLSLPWRRKNEPRVYRFNSFQYPFYKQIRVAIPLHWSIQRQIPKLKLDVVHTHTPFSMGLFGALVARQQKIPHLHTYHTLYPEYVKFYFPGFKRYNQRAAEKLSAVFCNRATQILAPSAGIQEKLRGYGITTPITTLATGIDQAFFEPAKGTGVRQRYKIPADAPLLITVARLGMEKSIDFLLKSFQQVLKYHPDAYYLIVGDGPARLELETLAKELGVFERVIFTGFIAKRTEVVKAYAAANVFVFASRTDTQCLTLLEAAAAGLPLVAVTDTPLTMALEHETNGFFTDPYEAKFAWKVQRLLTDTKLARQFGSRSRKIARRHSATRQAAALEKIYEETAAGYAADSPRAVR